MFSALNLVVIDPVIGHVTVHMNCHLICCHASLYVSSGEATLAVDVCQSASRNYGDAAAPRHAWHAGPHTHAYQQQQQQARQLLLFLVPLAGLPLLASCFYFCVVLLRIRGFCDFEFENSAQQQLVWSLVFVVFLYFEFISRLDALHSVLNSLYLHTLPMSKLHQQNRLFFRGVMTPTLLLVRPGLHSTDVGLLGVCHCHCHGRGAVLAEPLCKSIYGLPLSLSV